MEELLLEDNPLKAKKRTYKPGETKLSPDMQSIEDKFRPFNTNKDNGKKTKGEDELKKLILESEKLEQQRMHQLEQEAMAGAIAEKDAGSPGAKSTSSAQRQSIASAISEQKTSLEKKESNLDKKDSIEAPVVQSHAMEAN